MGSSSALHRATLLMCALATLVVQLTLWSAQQHPWIQLGGLAVALAISFGARWRLNSSDDGRFDPRVVVVLIALWLIPFLSEPLLRGVVGVGRPWEILVVVGLRNLMLGLTAVRNHRVCQRLACCASLFLTLFAFMLTFNWATSIITGVYSIVALWWLVGGYWERLSGKMPTATQRRLPKRATLSAVGAVAIVAITVGVVMGHGAPRRILAGFFPSSGGDGRGDRFATSGVGDGDQLISAKFDASSFGPVESEVFLESELPSLYDMFNESYGKAPKAKSERAIAIEFQESEDCQRQTATTTTNSRDFSTIRERPHAPRELDDRRAAAMLYLVGQCPTHLALETYDTFDGTRWSKSATPRFYSNLKLESVGGEPWLRTRSPAGQLFAADYQPYMVKVINLETERFPSPPHLAGVHIDRVDRLEFYGWTNEGILEMPNRDHIPQLTVIHMRALQPLGGRLNALGDFRTLLPSPKELAVQSGDVEGRPVALSHRQRLCRDLAAFYETPAGNDLANELCQGWISDKPAGWPQVQAVVEGLRQGFVHDAGATAPAACDDVVGYFLEAGRGPDYMFATTAAVMLREQGYATRLVGGFYADPRRYDRAANETAVLGEDVHMWAEVCIDGVHWVPIEPTPGYQPPPESLTASQRVLAAIVAALNWCLAHWVAIAAFALLTGGILVARRQLLDGIAWCAWWALGRGSAINRIRWTVWLLESRAALAGIARPRGTTFSRWCAVAANALPASAAEKVQDFALACDSALYGPGRSHRDLAGLCNSTVRVCRRKTFQQLEQNTLSTKPI